MRSIRIWIRALARASRNPRNHFRKTPVLRISVIKQDSPRSRIVNCGSQWSLARLWRDEGRRAEAHDLLAPVYGWLYRGFDTRDLKDAKALWRS
jgi:hypothetical protein